MRLFYLLIAMLVRQLLAALHSFNRFLCKFIDIHTLASLFGVHELFSVLYVL